MVTSDDFISKKSYPGHRVELHKISHALEDLPENVRAQITEIADLPAGISLRRKIFDELENAGLDSYGYLERVPLLRFLSDYPVVPYTYMVSPVLSRGQRPTLEKLADLYSRGHYSATINLCAEEAGGDGPLIEQAGLAREFQTYHLPVTDMNPLTAAQVMTLLDILTRPEFRLTYVHCEAGRGRTGVATACYRMAVMGWSAADALTEAKNFGCSVPAQQAFIQGFGKLLHQQDEARIGDEPSAGLALGRYPLKPLGSVKATNDELTATLASCARLETGEP